MKYFSLRKPRFCSLSYKRYQYNGSTIGYSRCWPLGTGIWLCWCLLTPSHMDVVGGGVSAWWWCGLLRTCLSWNAFASRIPFPSPLGVGWHQPLLWRFYTEGSHQQIYSLALELTLEAGHWSMPGIRVGRGQFLGAFRTWRVCWPVMVLYQYSLRSARLLFQWAGRTFHHSVLVLSCRTLSNAVEKSSSIASIWVLFRCP